MIKLDIQPYCESCYDFEPDVTRPCKLSNISGECIIMTDTIVRCEYAKRCENILRYLKQQSVKED